MFNDLKWTSKLCIKRQGKLIKIVFSDQPMFYKIRYIHRGHPQCVHQGEGYDHKKSTLKCNAICFLKIQRHDSDLFLLFFFRDFLFFRVSLVAQMVKNMPAMQEIWVHFSPWAWEDPLKEGMATHLSILAWRIPRTEESGGLQSMGSQRIGHDLACTYKSCAPLIWQKSWIQHAKKLQSLNTAFKVFAAFLCLIIS